MTTFAILLYILAGHTHWAGGLFAGCVWLGWTAWSRRPLGLPPGWQGLLVAAIAVGASAALSTRPSGLSWMGLLQWMSLLVGILALQDLLRGSEQNRSILLWGLLAGGMVDLVFWSQELLLAHWEWWTVRVDGLPLFPLRIRLFGSHGSTQAAAWLGACILLVAVWALPRLAGLWRWLGGLFLLWCSVLLGFCDSRLAMAGLLAAALMAGCAGRGGVWLAVATILPNLLWWIRDHVHPSQISMGGGLMQGRIQVVLAVATWATVLVARRWPRLALPTIVWRWCLGGGAFALTTCPAWLPLVTRSGGGRWATGRLEFWRVGLETWWASPILGTGPWTYSWAYAQQHDWLLGFLPMHPHNGLLEVLLAGGLVLLTGLVWAGWRALRDQASLPPIGIMTLLTTHLVVSMAFDSPLSSPQIQLLLIVVVGLAFSRAPVARVIMLPRTAGFAALLCLVPLGYVTEGLAGKAALQNAGEVIHAGRWEQGARTILDAFPSKGADLQWTRNALMARTALNANHRDSLELLAPLWDVHCRLEPGYLPNRIHRDFVRVRLGLDSVSRPQLLARFDTLGRAGWNGFQWGPVPESWRTSYPTDDPAFWMRRLETCSDRGCGDTLRWLTHWFAARTVPSSAAEARWRAIAGLEVRALMGQSKQEVYLYGSEGARWLLIPQLKTLLPRLNL